MRKPPLATEITALMFNSEVKRVGTPKGVRVPGGLDVADVNAAFSVFLGDDHVDVFGVFAILAGSAHYKNIIFWL